MATHTHPTIPCPICGFGRKELFNVKVRILPRTYFIAVDEFGNKYKVEEEIINQICNENLYKDFMCNKPINGDINENIFKPKNKEL